MTPVTWLLFIGSLQGGQGSVNSQTVLEKRDPGVVFIWDEASLENGKTAAAIGKLEHFKQFAATKDITKDGTWVAHLVDDYYFCVDSSLIHAELHKELANFSWPKSFSDIKSFRLSEMSSGDAQTMRKMALASPWGSEFNTILHAGDPGLYYELAGSISSDGKTWSQTKSIARPDPYEKLKLAPREESVQQAYKSIVERTPPTRTLIQASSSMSQPSMRGYLNVKAAELVLKLREEQLSLERAVIAKAISESFGKLNDGSLLDESKSIQLKDLPPGMQERLKKAYGADVTQGEFHLRLRLFIGFPTNNGMKAFAVGMIR